MDPWQRIGEWLLAGAVGLVTCYIALLALWMCLQSVMH